MARLSLHIYHNRQVCRTSIKQLQLKKCNLMLLQENELNCKRVLFREIKKINPCIWVHKLQVDETKNKVYTLFNITRINEALSPART